MVRYHNDPQATEEAVMSHAAVLKVAGQGKGLGRRDMGVD